MHEGLFAQLFKHSVCRGDAGGGDGWRSGAHHWRLAAAEEVVPFGSWVQAVKHVLPQHLLRAGDGAAVLIRVAFDGDGRRHLGKPYGA